MENQELQENLPLTEDIKKEIKSYIEKNQPEMDWYGFELDKKQIQNILESGFDSWIDELYEYNQEYIWELEDGLINDIIEQYTNDENEIDGDEIREYCREFICVDMNIKNLLSRIPDITCLIYLYSNYDCCNSFDEFEKESYIYEVYKRVKSGVDKNDYLYEFENGAYGGSLFCFAFQTDIKTCLELKEQLKTGSKVLIPKGTQFGFFSSFQGAGSLFDKRTVKDMKLNIKETGKGYCSKYDYVGIMADVEQHYSMIDVYGQNDFIDGQNVSIK